MVPALALDLTTWVVRGGGGGEAGLLPGMLFHFPGPLFLHSL